MNDQPGIYAPGMVFDPRMAPFEGGMYSWQDEMHIIVLSFRTIQRSEKLAIEAGLWYVGLHVEQNVIHLLFKADAPHQRPGILWHDMPYSWQKVPEGGRSLPMAPADIPAGLGALIFVFLLDAPTGKIVAFNVKNLSHDFTRQLHQAILDQSQHPFDAFVYEARVARIREQYPTPEALARVAQATCLAGIKER